MLSKQNRLQKDWQVRRVLKKGRRFSKANFTLKNFKQRVKTPFRCTIIVPVAYSKKAVLRNKIKRQVRGIITGIKNEIKPGFDFTLSIYKSKKIQEFAEVKEVVVGLLKMAGLISNS